ncbi:putative ATPases of the HSP70 class involved in cell division [Yersinia ruckeri]|uniref:type IV pilus biogenesis protein PilM n=1 Tax=Yersinia ruckeri TaxID=29486 RepID=UPI0005AD1147|nr:pilus assembly protein PilM [Yersinia ruckeri]AJI93879.1 putative ATPases of the HSP70 class involved in cell division [Yersinia ruckeri]MCW6567047.1 pilus assembly protein PilM [Yersinia ruckeri]
MYAQIWQVGLDIQMSSVRALAVLRRRYGWQLRYWWQQPLPDGVLQNGNLQHLEALSELLSHLRKQLPRHISLRITLPIQRILQQNFALPDKRLKEPDRSHYIYSAAARQFPLISQVLALDYRENSAEQQPQLITAARQQDIERWQHCLQQADFQPEVIDISPCALRYMANAAGLQPQHLLVHGLEKEWLWTTSADMPFRYGLIPAPVDRCASEILAELHRLNPAVDAKPYGVYYSGMLAGSLPANTRPWSPFIAFRQRQPPFPVSPMSFALAGGLAIRPVDADVSG